MTTINNNNIGFDYKTKVVMLQGKSIPQYSANYNLSFKFLWPRQFKILKRTGEFPKPPTVAVRYMPLPPPKAHGGRMPLGVPYLAPDIDKRYLGGLKLKPYDPYILKPFSGVRVTSRAIKEKAEIKSRKELQEKLNEMLNQGSSVREMIKARNQILQKNSDMLPDVRLRDQKKMSSAIIYKAYKRNKARKAAVN